jgi:hypothetical protein
MDFVDNTGTTFRKLDMFPTSGDESKTPTHLGPFERANLSLCTPITEVSSF